MFSPHVSSDLSSPAADSGVSECLALTSDSETEIFCDSVDSVEQLSSIRVRRGPGSGARARWTPVSEVCLSHDQPNFFSYFTLDFFGVLQVPAVKSNGFPNGQVLLESSGLQDARQVGAGQGGEGGSDGKGQGRVSRRRDGGRGDPHHGWREREFRLCSPPSSDSVSTSALCLQPALCHRWCSSGWSRVGCSRRWWGWSWPRRRRRLRGRSGEAPRHPAAATDHGGAKETQRRHEECDGAAGGGGEAGSHTCEALCSTHTHTHHQAGATGMNEVISCFLSDRSMDRGERVFSVQLHARRSGRLRSTC